MSQAFNMTQYCFASNVLHHSDKSALLIVDAEGEVTTLSYSQLYNDILKCAQGLGDLGLAPGARVLIRSENNLHFLLVYFAAMAASLVPIATLFSLKQAEVEFILQDTEASLLYQSSDTVLPITVPKTCQILDGQQLRGFMQQPLLEEFSFHTNADDPAYIVYTSGSSGYPKGVVHAHRAVLGREPIRQAWLDLHSHDTTLVTGKPCWTYSMGVGFVDTWVMGATAILYLGAHTAQAWLSVIKNQRVTLLASQPKSLKELTWLLEKTDSDVASLTRITSAGEKLPEKIHVFWQQKFNIPIYEALGMSEMSTFISFCNNVPYRVGSVGKIQPERQVAIFKPDKAPELAAPMEVGQLAVHRSNPGFMLRYMSKMDHRNTPFSGEWFMTGDLVHQDKDDYIFYHGRADDVLIVSGGDRVSPLEIENLIMTISGVADVACGLSTVEHQSLLTAYVVAHDTTQQKSLEAQFHSTLMTQVIAYKVPKRFVWLDNIPRNTNGKIVRSQLKSLD